MKKRRTTKYTGAYFTVEQAMTHYRKMTRRERIKSMAKTGLSVLFAMWIALALGAAIGKLWTS